MPPDIAPEFEARAALYQEYLAERAEILRHKWFLSQSACRDVGWEFSLLDWVRHHRATWKKERNKRGASTGSS